MVECQLPKLDVAGSTPVSRSKPFNDLQPANKNSFRSDRGPLEESTGHSEALLAQPCPRVANMTSDQS